MFPILAAIPIIGDLVKGVTGIIDELVEDKDKANEIRAAVVLRAMDAQSTAMQAGRDVVVAEAKGESWLQRNWRPILMLTFAGLVVARWFGLSDHAISEAVEMKLWDIIQIGVGGYVVGRSVEKTAPAVAEVFKAAASGLRR